MTYERDKLIKLGEKTNNTANDLVFVFGKYLTHLFAILFSSFESSSKSSSKSSFKSMFEFMKFFDNHIPVKVQKIIQMWSDLNLVLTTCPYFADTS
jgi:hypothetical protein